MQNKFRLFVYFILSLLIVIAAMCFLMPTKQQIKRSITINTAPNKIYAALSKLENFNRISVWGQQDSLLQYSFAGTDGTVGATTTWKGNPEISGEGKIEITELVSVTKIMHAINFTKPKKGNATSTFTLYQPDKDKTEVTWLFEVATPRPWNIFNLFFSLDKQMGADFEKGLAALKLIIELK